MKVIIAGCRDFEDYEFLKINVTLDFVNLFMQDNEITIVSGAAPGADKLGERFAKEHNLPLMRFPADWDKHGKAAGPIRNKTTAEYADRLIAFWDLESKGTENMIKTMTALGKPVSIHIIGEK